MENLDVIAFFVMRDLNAMRGRGGAGRQYRAVSAVKHAPRRADRHSSRN